MQSRTLIPVLVLSLATTAAQANLLTNGDFESEPNFNMGLSGDGSYTLLDGANIPGWTIEAGHGVTIHNNGYPTISGTYSVNMDGEGYNGHNANFYQDFASSAGTPYTLTFDWSIWQNNYQGGLMVSVTDTVTNLILSTGTYNAASGLFSETQAFAGTGNALRLRVEESPESGFNDNKFIVDNFSVQAVPEPGAFAALGLGAVALIRRRRR